MRHSLLYSVGALVLVCLIVGCSKRDRKREQAMQAAQDAVEKFTQKLVLDVDGKSVELPLEAMDVYLTEKKKAPESFVIHGNGVELSGTFPKGVRVDYDENWSVLVGRDIAITPSGGSRESGESTLTLPGGPPLKVLGGSFTVTEVKDGFDAKTPLSGRIEIKCQTPKGEKTFKGTFGVLGTTWG